MARPTAARGLVGRPVAGDPAEPSAVLATIGGVRPADFFRTSDITVVEDDPFSLSFAAPARQLNEEMLDELRRRPAGDRSDIEVAVPLARLVHDQLQAYGTGGEAELDDEQMRLAIQALHAVTRRLALDEFKVPFHDFTSFRSWWIKNGASGSGGWQARRDLLSGIFDSLHDRLAHVELESLESSLVEPISPHSRTGWSAVDTEISEMRRHFNSARTPQDYRAVGLDCVAVSEALSARVYDPARHLRPGEEEPPVAKTKQRIERFIEDVAPDSDNAALRKLARAVVKYAQHVKHSDTPTRREAGIAADAVIQLANMLRRLEEPQ